MASDEELKSNIDDDFEWNVENEIRLFEAMIGHKPVGINKHFHMACISEKFETLIGKPISSDIIWKHLGTMFDLSKLDKKESLPFPNEVEEFSLPEAEYSDLMNEKLTSKTETTTDSKENLKTSKESNVKETVTKKDKKSEVEEANTEVDKKETVESENENKKGKVTKDEKPVKRRGYRSLKDKKQEEETPPTPVSSSKKEEESVSAASSSNKKEKKPIGKRSLRSRGDDSSNKSSTPPPVKRPRRI